MTTAEILAAAANQIEDDDGWSPDRPTTSVSGVIHQIAPSVPAAVKAIRFFANFVPSDGISWERKLGRTKDEVVRALRDAAAESSS